MRGSVNQLPRSRGVGVFFIHALKLYARRTSRQNGGHIKGKIFTKSYKTRLYAHVYLHVFELLKNIYTAVFPVLSIHV